MTNLMNGDCLQLMGLIPDRSVDLILTDPPYGTIKGMGKSVGWDQERRNWDEVLPTADMYAECDRVLRPNGCLVLFCQEPYTHELIHNEIPNLPFCYRLTWVKDTFGNPLTAKRAPLNYTEDVCVCFKRHTKHDFEGFHPVRPYASSVAAFIGKNKKELFDEMGHQGMCHFMRFESSQFNLCTEKTYTQLSEMYGLFLMPGFRSYEDLKAEDTEYREALIEKMTAEFPKVFNLPDGAGHRSNILEFKKDRPSFHPTQKPVALLEDLIATYTHPGHVVLDFTMGSGSTGVAAVNTGRDFIGIELDEKYFDIAQGRISEAITGRMFS